MFTFGACFYFLFFNILFLWHEPTIRGVNGAPSSNLIPKRNSTLSHDREGRFLGKITVTAGLGLPEQSSSSTSPKLDRKDVIEEQTVIASHNYPPKRWGPYFTAVFEPTISLFLKDPLKYLANIFNPYKWFGPKTLSVTTTTENPTTLTITTLDHRNQDDNNVVIIVSDSSVDDITRNEDRRTDKNFNKFQIVNVTDDSLTSKDEIDRDLYVTQNDETTNDFAENEDFSNEVYQSSSTTKKPRRTTKRSKRTKSTTKGTTTTTADSTMSSSNYPIYSVPPPQYYPPPRPSYGPPSYPQPPFFTTTTLRPPNYYPPAVNGGYYQGYPQNVSHLEFTTSTENTLNFLNFNSRLPSFQQNTPNFDYFGYSEQFSSQQREYNEFLPVNNRLSDNVFKPSFPYHIS